VFLGLGCLGVISANDRALGPLSHCCDLPASLGGTSSERVNLCRLNAYGLLYALIRPGNDVLIDQRRLGPGPGTCRLPLASRDLGRIGRGLSVCRLPLPSRDQRRLGPGPGTCRLPLASRDLGRLGRGLSVCRLPLPSCALYRFGHSPLAPHGIGCLGGFPPASLRLDPCGLSLPPLRLSRLRHLGSFLPASLGLELGGQGGFSLASLGLRDLGGQGGFSLASLGLRDLGGQGGFSLVSFGLGLSSLLPQSLGLGLSDLGGFSLASLGLRDLSGQGGFSLVSLGLGLSSLGRLILPSLGVCRH